MKGYDPYEALANAIIEQTADDYTRALCATKGKTKSCKMIITGMGSTRVHSDMIIGDCESFFTKQGRIGAYSNIDGKALMLALQEEAKECGYDYKKIIKSRKPEKTKEVERYEPI